MPADRKEPSDKRREPSDFVRRAASQGESRMAIPHASLKRRAMGLMKQPLRTDLFRPAAQPHDVEEVFVPRRFNFVEGGDPPPEPAEEPRRAPRARRREEEEEEERREPQIDLEASDDEADLEDVDIDLPQSRPLEAGEELDLPDLEEYDGSDLFGKDDPDEAAEPAIPAEERTELPSALRNRRNYYANSDEARKGGLLGGIIPGSSRPAAKSGPKAKSKTKRR